MPKTAKKKESVESAKSAEPRVMPWVMPDWMKQYEHMIGNTGGNSIAELMNDHNCTMRNNAVRSVLIISVESQITTLTRLHKAGCLKDVPHA